ncbi:MAG: flagellar biosynthesis anti-sigma factor FlgM [Chitinophagales bacterium]
MIINGQVQNLLKVYGQQLKTEKTMPKKEVAGQARKADEVLISGEGKFKQKLITAYKQVEEPRSGKTDELKEAIAAGTYTVNNEEVAEKILSDILTDILV